MRAKLFVGAVCAVCSGWLSVSDVVPALLLWALAAGFVLAAVLPMEVRRG